MHPVFWFAAAATLLSLERLCYVWAWRRTASFQAFCRVPLVRRWGGEPVVVLEKLFYVFKAIQLVVFLGWCILVGGSLQPASAAPLPMAVGVLLMSAGQVLNAAVFQRLGRVGVFYGNRLGHDVPWCDAFPFSILRHPQYVGAVITIWGFFVLMRFPEPDWIILPLLETFYYAVGSWLES